MKLSKIDLSSLRAIAHDDDGLKLLIEREDEIEHIEISAPLAAYEGLQLLDRIIASTAAIEPGEEPIEMIARSCKLNLIMAQFTNIQQSSQKFGKISNRLIRSGASTIMKLKAITHPLKSSNSELWCER